MNFELVVIFVLFVYSLLSTACLTLLIIITFFCFFQIADLSFMETRAEFEEKKRVVQELQERLAEAEHQLVEGEKLRKKLHNTILVLFFCSYYLFYMLQKS